MLHQPPTRQRIRKALVILAFLSFPVSMNFLSPYVIIDGTMKSVVNGSLIIFGLTFVASLFMGRRAGCHTICWMAPFMVIGRWIRNRFGWASLQLVTDSSVCSNCMTRSKNCPMGLDLNSMVQIEQMENPECILCGTCVDNCTKKAIHYSFSATKK